MTGEEKMKNEYKILIIEDDMLLGMTKRLPLNASTAQHLHILEVRRFY